VPAHWPARRAIDTSDGAAAAGIVAALARRRRRSAAPADATPWRRSAREDALR
jgi:hypothetical protein